MMKPNNENLVHRKIGGTSIEEETGDDRLFASKCMKSGVDCFDTTYSGGAPLEGMNNVEFERIKSESPKLLSTNHEANNDPSTDIIFREQDHLSDELFQSYLNVANSAK